MHHLPYHLNKLFFPPPHTHSVFMSSYDSHNKQLIFSHISNGTVFIMQMECVICEVRTGFVCIIQMHPTLKPEFDPGDSSCGICGGQSDIGKAFSPQYFRFPLSVSPHQRSKLIFIYMLLLPEGQKGEDWEPSKTAVGRIWQDVLSHFGGFWWAFND